MAHKPIGIESASYSRVNYKGASRFDAMGRLLTAHTNAEKGIEGGIGGFETGEMVMDIPVTEETHAGRCTSVIPVQAGIQCNHSVIVCTSLDPRVRGDDDWEEWKKRERLPDSRNSRYVRGDDDWGGMGKARTFAG